MKTEYIINGYRILREFTTAGGGLCRWTFAEKSGSIFFLKEFLSPTYPNESGPGSPKIKEQKRRRCEEFEQHHRKLNEAISPRVSFGGNLISTLDFFRHGAKYYKVTEKVDAVTLKTEHIAKLPFDQRLLIVKTCAHSLKILHHLNIVHGDLKPDNILIKQTEERCYAAKLIDFDNSYFAHEPPEDIVGDIVYYSPELAKYIQREKTIKPKDLYAASDIFSLGLIYCQYLTGKLPTFSDKYQYPWMAVNNGETLCINPDGMPITVINLVNKMLDVRADQRPPIRQVLDNLKTWDKKVEVSPVELRGTLFRKKTKVFSSTPPTESRLTGTLIKKKIEDDEEEYIVLSGESRLKGTLIKKKK